jgi:hypothetical protein
MIVNASSTSWWHLVLSKQHPDLVGATLKKHSMLMCVHPPGRGRLVNNIDLGPTMDENEQNHEVTTHESGQVMQFDKDGLVCHLTDDSALYQYESDNESLHSCPFAAHIVHIDEYEHRFIPDKDDYLVSPVGEAVPNGMYYEDDVYVVGTANGAPVDPEQVVNWTSTSTLPPTSTHSASGRPQSM